MICPKCNQQLDDNAKFCISCGEKIEAPVEEPVAEVAEPVAETSAPAEEVPAEVPVAPAASPAAEKINEIKNKVIQKPLVAGGIGVAVIAIILILALVLPSMGGAVNYAMYIKDGEVMITDLPKADGWAVTDEPFDNVSEERYDDYAWTLGTRINVSEDGKKIFYIEDFDTDDYTFSLYCRDARNEKKDPVKIASDVKSYSITADGKLVTYLDADGDLCQHDLKEKTKIAKDVENFEVSEDGKTFLYADEDQSLYLKSGKKDEERIAKEIDSLSYVSEDFSAIYYVKNGSLYVKEGKKDAKKLLSDIEDVICVYDSGEIYYTVSADNEATLWDYVEDDMKSDADVEEPVEPEYPEYPDAPKYSDFDDSSDYWDAYDEYRDECDRLDEEYDNARDAYWDAYYDYEEIADRNRLREELKNTVYGTSKYSLCYFDGKKDTVITENFGGTWETRSYTSPLIIYYEAAKGGEGKLKLSEIEGTWDVENYLYNGNATGDDAYVAIKANAQELDVEDKAYDFTISSDEKTVYFFDEADTEKQTADLYKMEISGKKVSKPELYDSDVYCNVSEYGYAYSYLSFLGNDVAYFKDVKDNNEGDLVINKKTVDSDVSVTYLFSGHDSESGKLYYFTDFDGKAACGTLKMYNGKKAVAVQEDVKSYALTPDGDLLYICDFSDKHMVGDLYLYNGKKSTKVDEDVVCIITYTYAGE